MTPPDALLPVAAVIATYRRPVELARLFESLALEGNRVARVVVVDNGNDESTRLLCMQAPFQAEWIPLPENPGCGAAWQEGGKRVFSEVSHILYLDDDVVLPSGFVQSLLSATLAAGAEVSCPILKDRDGRIWAFPEPKIPALRRSIRQAATPEECLLRLGEGPHEFVWCAGACILVSRHATETSGFHRGDFRILGEDLEYSLRLSDRHRCVFFPKLVAGHLSPPRPPGDTRTAHRAKFACLLRNLSYLSFHIPHRAHLRRYLPGNFRRFFRTFGLSSATLAVALKCFWLGAVRGSPAGETQMAQGKGRQ